MRDKFCSAPLSIIGGVLTLFFFNSRRLLIDPLVLFMLHMQLLKFLFLKLSELCWTQ